MKIRSPFLALLLLVAVGTWTPLRATQPSGPDPLLIEALGNWDRGGSELAFTQETRILERDGSIKETRLERYDPSKPDHERWALLAVDGREPTADDIERIQDRRNNKPRKKPMRPLGEYLDYSTIDVVAEDADTITYQVLADNGSAFLVDLEQLQVLLTIDKATADIVNIGAQLRDDMKIAFGIARVTGLNIDVDILPDESTEATAGELGDESHASAEMRKWGRPYEFTWTDLERVQGYES
ncbi:hypothetical protein [Actomonas aquatica]|uniref:DUF4412 domain-containing protein n=1 Tax=Actomonas aquatica TaxID=2866162 RepID=A0ABZ1C3R1_9BACT|nr:hypothetical protein [Opitutus sp. WL0086]WRQ86012.1 hypothetical protein K1X11_014455 [Opitutus sp. WL0086]